MSRAKVTPEPQRLVSYENPNVFLPGLGSGGGGAPGQTILPILAGAAFAGYSASPSPSPGGHFPMTSATLVGAAAF